MTPSLFISPLEFLLRLSAVPAPWLLDVRRDGAFSASAYMMAGAVRCAPQDVPAWAAAHAAQRGQSVLVYCVYGHSVSAQACQQLRELGFDAKALAGGFHGGQDGVDAPADIAHWRSVKLPVVATSQQVIGAAS